MLRIGIFPLHRFRRLIVLPNMAHDFPFQILLGLKDATSDEVPLNLGKPQFDMVEPGDLFREAVLAAPPDLQCVQVV